MIVYFFFNENNFVKENCLRKVVEILTVFLTSPFLQLPKEYLVECNREIFITENFCPLKSLQDSLVSICILYYFEYQESVTLTLSFS